MADTKISALTALVAGDIQHTSDVVAIVDTSVTTTKKATAQAVVNAVLAQNTDTTVTGTINQTTIPTSKTLLVSTDIGSTVQGYDAQLADVAGLAVTDGNFIVGNGTNFVAESGSTARTSLGLGTGDSPEFTAVNIGNATDTTVTRVSAGVIAVEGSNVLLASNIGTTVQGYDADTAKLDVVQTFTAAQTFNNPTVFSAGTASLPSITFTGDTNTGIFSPAADTIAFTEGGAEAMRIDSSGNVGIGTTSPLLPLHVVTTGTGTAMGDNASATFRSGASGRASTIQLSDGTNSNYVSSLSGALGFGTGSTERMRIDSSGNVGIGTSSPVNLGAGYTSLTINNATNGGGIVFAQNGTQKGAIFNVANDVYFDVSNGAGNLYFRNTGDGTTNATIDSSGNVGIGTTSPNCRLQIEGTTDGIYSRVRNSAGTSARIAFESAGVASASIGIPSGTAALAFYLSSETTERARITSGGYFKASNDGNYVETTQCHELKTTEDARAVIVACTNATYSSDAIQIRISRNTTNNSFYALGYFNTGAAAYKFRVADSGNVTNTNGSYGTISDAKLKQDIVDASSQWDDIKNLRFRKYRLKSEVELDPNAKSFLGLVAQEAELVSPGLIEEHKDTKQETKTREVEKTREIPAVLDEEGNEVEPAFTEIYTDTEEYTETVDLGTTTKSIKTSILYMKAVKALQEAMTRIETLEAQNAAFEARLAALEAK